MPPPSSVPAVVMSRMDRHSRTDLPRLYWKNECYWILSVLTANFPAEPRWTGYSEAKDDGSGGNNWSSITCKAPVSRSPPTNQHPWWNAPVVYSCVEQLVAPYTPPKCEHFLLSKTYNAACWKYISNKLTRSLQLESY